MSNSTDPEAGVRVPAVMCNKCGTSLILPDLAGWQFRGGSHYCPLCVPVVEAVLGADRPRFSDRHLAQVTRDRDRANVILAHIVESLDAAEDTAWEHLPDAVRELRTRVTELEAWQARTVQQARRAIDDLDRWNRLWIAADTDSAQLEDLIDSVLDQRDAARALVDRVRLALSNHPRCDVHPDDDVISCGWKSAVASVQWALDQVGEVTDHG